MALEKKEEDFKILLNEQAKGLFGDERAKELEHTLAQLASSIVAISKYEIPLEAEPAFFKTE